MLKTALKFKLIRSSQLKMSLMENAVSAKNNTQLWLVKLKQNLSLQFGSGRVKKKEYLLKMNPKSFRRKFLQFCASVGFCKLWISASTKWDMPARWMDIHFQEGTWKTHLETASFAMLNVFKGKLHFFQVWHSWHAVDALPGVCHSWWCVLMCFCLMYRLHDAAEVLHIPGFLCWPCSSCGLCSSCRW